MRVVGYVNPALAHHRQKMTAIAEGMLRHGVRLTIKDYREYSPSDLAVMWGHRHTHIVNGQRTQGADYLVMERGFVGDRMRWTACGFNGLNGRGIYHTRNVTSDRWDALFSGLLRPQRMNDDGYILVMGQCPGDVSLRGKCIYRWARVIASRARAAFPRRDVFFRPHPLRRPANPTGVPTMDCDLRTALDGAFCVVTYNSNSGVDAALNGNRVVAWDEGSVAWPVSTHTLTDAPRHFPRRKWAAKLAWMQWTDDEIRRGDTWEHLKQRYE